MRSAEGFACESLGRPSVVFFINPLELTMPRLTKLELEQIITARNAELVAAREQLSLLKQRIEVLERSAAVVDAKANTYRAMATTLTAPTSAYRQALVAAREHAMRTGRSVLVGGAA